ncbi:hypothetical protein AcV5_010039 [Taiwanofungus camphoratus]|nr:hypothetical protein AcV5_010039 [Antrodia cinnamomea]
MKCSISPYPTPLVAKYDSTPECHLHVLPSLAGNAPLDVIFSNTCDRFGTAGQKVSLRSDAMYGRSFPGSY